MVELLKRLVGHWFHGGTALTIKKSLLNVHLKPTSLHLKPISPCSALWSSREQIFAFFCITALLVFEECCLPLSSLCEKHSQLLLSFLIQLIFYILLSPLCGPPVNHFFYRSSLKSGATFGGAQRSNWSV